MALKPRPPLFIFLSLFVSCAGHEQKKESPAASEVQTLSDTNYKKKDSKLKDTSTSKSIAMNADDSPEPSVETILADFYKECRDTVRIDTTITYKKNSLHISFSHYSTNDSLIHLPYRYIEYTRLKEFITHHFESSLRIRNHDSVLLDTIIRNKIFDPYAEQNLVSYGAIFYSGINFLPDRLRIDYSYSIALTDLGMPVHLEYEYSGKLNTKDEYH
jgi:hypothetical protein